MEVATIAPMTYTPGEKEDLQFIRGGIGADYHQGPAFVHFAAGAVRMTWGARDFDECSPYCVTLYSDSRDRSTTWSAAQVYMTDYPAGPLGGPVLSLQGGREAPMVVVQARHEIETGEARRVATPGSSYLGTQSYAYVRRSVDGAGSSIAAGKLKVNLLLNRASRWADVASHIPYRGQVDVEIKQDLDLEIRLAEWVKPEEARCAVQGQSRALTFDGRYAQVGAVKAGQTVTLTFPIPERTDRVIVEKRPYTLIRRGNDVVWIDPPGKNRPLYQRGHYRQGETLWKNVRRFVPEAEIEWC